MLETLRVSLAGNTSGQLTVLSLVHVARRAASTGYFI